MIEEDTKKAVLQAHEKCRRYTNCINITTSSFKDYKSDSDKKGFIVVKDEYKPSQTIKNLSDKFRKQDKGIVTVISKVKQY